MKELINKLVVYQPTMEEVRVGIIVDYRKYSSDRVEVEIVPTRHYTEDGSYVKFKSYGEWVNIQNVIQDFIKISN